jgi:hypothetical protein
MVLAAIGVFLVAKSLRVGYVYSVESTIYAAPGDDQAFTSWLKAQPGIVPHTAGITRTDSRPPKLVVIFIMVRNGWGYPPFPDLESKARELGYEIDEVGFVDSPR